MLDVQTEIHGEAVNATTKGCGCGSNSTVKMASLTAQQIAVVEAIQRVNKRKNSIYKTQNRFFM